ncbi:MAG: alpha/beta hydrolase, partial [Limisphaerales bacterium]
YLLVNAPDNYYTGFSWYDFSTQPGVGIKRSRDFLFWLVDDLREKDFPTDQIILFGFSQGCLMMLEVGLRSPHLFAGLIGVSGYAHEPEKLLQELSPVARHQHFLITHGTQDTLIPFATVKKQIEQLQRAGLQIEWREFHKAHTIAGETELKVIRDFIEKCF